MNEFLMLPMPVPGTRCIENYFGIPFEVARHGGNAVPLEAGKPVCVNDHVSAMFFLGMTTVASSGQCGWSGERFHAWQGKLFVGDMLGRLDILYEKNQMDAIPLIFGVNVWNYDTIYGHREYEGDLYPVCGPYPEPFSTDRAAAELLRSSLVLHENDADKYTKFILAVRTRERRLEKATLTQYGSKLIGVGISAITALKRPGDPGSLPFLFTDADYYVRKMYFKNMDLLSRRISQYLDELPAHFSQDIPTDYKGPRMEFHGRAEAELLANVYYHNISDMLAKIDDDGTLHTSTKNAPSFGFYSGIGTYRSTGQYNYHEQAWSRDMGRLLCELAEHGECAKCAAGADYLLKYLYQPGSVYAKPHWKRIVNASELGAFPESYEGRSLEDTSRGKENDGHASVMIMLARLYRHGVVDAGWLAFRRKALMDAAEWICWQMDDPVESCFDDVLCSESETTYGDMGGYDLLSNSYAYEALKAFSGLFRVVGDPDYSEKLACYADRLYEGIIRKFTTRHPRFGTVFTEPESDNWPSELKRLALLHLQAELHGYDPVLSGMENYPIWLATYKAQKESYWNPRMGGSMGYGQGYNTQTALLLDDVEEYGPCLDWAARFCYHHSEFPYIVPEGVTCHPSGRFWYRHTDLGNAVQQTEIVKCIRLVAGMDDLDPENGLQLVPRLPLGWTGTKVTGYPIAACIGGLICRVSVDLEYDRIDGGYELTFTAEKPIALYSVRIGPFDECVSHVAVDGSEILPELAVINGHAYVYMKHFGKIDHLKVRVADNRKKRFNKGSE